MILIDCATLPQVMVGQGRVVANNALTLTMGKRMAAHYIYEQGGVPTGHNPTFGDENGEFAGVAIEWHDENGAKRYLRVGAAVKETE